MDLTLYLPGLLLPEPVLADTVYDLAAPSLALLLGRSKRRELPAGWLAESFGMPEPLPAAALRKVSVGETADGEWLCLDPVHWNVTREGITLDDPARLNLKREEADSLIESLGPLFAGWGELSASAPGCWELRLQRHAALETRPLGEIVGQRVAPALPGGADGRSWRHLLAEAQTLLHAHPVNRRREEHNLPLANSLWPWGGGSLPAAVRTGFRVAWSEDPVIAGLCLQAGIACLVPPARFEPASGPVLAILDHFLPAARQLDALAWRAGLEALERDWLVPALVALRQRACSRLQLVGTAVGGTRTLAFELRPGDLMRFWRRPQPLTALAAIQP